MLLLRHLILSLIRLYQKYISPAKGFKCAYAHLYENGTCSSRIYEIVRCAPFKEMRSQISFQFRACALASKAIENDRPNRKDTEECNDKLWGAACGCFSV
jgi:putative component of membrane protein insertase Oxa1/YidC/SpoIIIJ protein YidD